MNSKSTYINDEDRLFDHTVVSLTERARHTLKQPLKGFPHYADTRTGEWTTTEDGFWTGGFWPGVLWLGGFFSGDLTLWQAAEEWVERLDESVHVIVTSRPAAIGGFQNDFSRHEKRGREAERVD